MNFKITHIFPNMTKNVKLRMCKKCSFYFSPLEDFIAGVDAIS